MATVEADARPATDSRTFDADFIPALDGLRGIAVLWVMLHNGLAFDFGAERIKPLSILANAGWVGVQLFFVLSGFLITRNLLRAHGRPDYFRSFFIKRALRILPLCYVFLFVALIIVPLVWPNTEAGPPFQAGHLWHWTFLFNWSLPLGWPSYGIPHFWSLAVEEQFYLVWPFIVHRWTGLRLLRLCGALILFALASRIALVLAGASADMIYEFTTSRIDALALGAGIAVLLHQREYRERVLRTSHVLLPAAAGMFLIAAITTVAFSRDIAPTQTLGHLLLALACSLLILDAVVVRSSRARWIDRALSSPPLLSCGRYSFGMYVLHFPIARALAALGGAMEARLGPSYLLVWYATLVVLTFIAAWLSYRILELPFLELKKRLVPA